MNIDSAPVNQVLSQATAVNFFRILENGARYSHSICKKLLAESSLLADLTAFLPKDNREAQQAGPEEYPLIMDTISLLNAMIGDQPI